MMVDLEKEIDKICDKLLEKFGCHFVGEVFGIKMFSYKLVPKNTILMVDQNGEILGGIINVEDATSAPSDSSPSEKQNSQDPPNTDPKDKP